MSNSNTKPLLVLLAAASVGGTTFADRLTLKDDARLTGTVRSINGQGTVELSTVLASEPLLLRAAAVTRMDFNPPEAAPGGNPTTLVELTNGDTLPATIGSLDDSQLKVDAGDLGGLTVPRAALKSMQVGMHPQHAFYSGPASLEEWTKGEEGARNWRFTNHSLVASGNAKASRSFDLPQRFVVKFTLKWRTNPNFQVFFADPLSPGVERVDRYYLQFNSGGVEIKREAGKGKRYQSVILLPRTPDQFPENQLEVEIRVDRSKSRLELLLNGAPETAGVDPIPDKPTGGGIVIVSNSAPGGSQEISGIEVREYDNSQTRHLAEDRGDGKTDSLISRDEDRLGGHLTAIRKGEAGNVFSIASDFQDAPLEIPEADVSTVFFARKPAEGAPPAALPLVLRLRGQGVLHISSCTFSENTVTARHPLLGELVIARAGISSLERLNPEPEGQSK